MPAAPDTDLDTRRPFSRADAIAAGIDPGLIRGSRFRRIFRGVYVDASVTITPAVHAEAALVPFPSTAFASHASAARVHGVPIPTLPEEHVSVLDPDHRRQRRGIRCHVVREAEGLTVEGVRVSGYSQMFVELAELVSLVDLVIVGDHLARKRWVSPEDLRRYCTHCTRDSAPAARVAASYVRDRVDSPMETRLRMLLVLAGLPEPTVNREVRGVDGTLLRRYDLTYEKSRTIIEYDGRQHVERIENWESDLDRREEIDEGRWRILVVIANGVHRDPEATLRKVWRVLRQRGEPGVPARLTDDWRPHFPGRR